MEHLNHQTDATVAGLAPALESKVFCIRKNDPNMNHLYIGSGLDVRAWKQLGRWLHTNAHVKYFCLMSCHLEGKAMSDLCTGLQYNQSIREFEICDNRLRNAEMQSLAPFIRTNPNLHTLNLEGCLRPCGVDILSSALMSRTQSIENVSLDGNCMGNSETTETFDTFITALSKNRELRRLSLIGNQIGVHGCISLARLFTDHSKLKSLILRHNCIDDECAAILAESLSNNVQLNNIDLDRNERVSAKGLMKFLQLISRIPSATIRIRVQWRCPHSTDEMSTVLKVKINEPLYNMGSQLRANENFPWGSDMSNVNLFHDRWSVLDWSETAFFHGMKEGDFINIGVESGDYQRFPWCDADATTALDLNTGGNSGIYETLASNHALSSVGYETALRRNFLHGNLLREFLEANKPENKRTAERVKIFRCHVQYSLSVEEFCEMDVVVQPHILAWIGRALSVTDDGRIYLTDPPPPVVRLDATYSILRAMPAICGF